MEETIGERLRRLRQAKNWTQVTLAYTADRAPSVISQVETGKREPELSTIKALAEALEVDWRYLLLGDQLPKVPAPSTSGLRSSGEDRSSAEELVSLEVALQRTQAAGAAAGEVAHDWRRESARSLEEGRPLPKYRILEMYSFHNELSRLYVGHLNSILEGARLGIVGITNGGVNQYLDHDPRHWPRELKELLYEAGTRVAALPQLINEIELEASEQSRGAAERALYEEFNVETNHEEMKKALAEVGA